jgi:hypothetical protein
VLPAVRFSCFLQARGKHKKRTAGST